MAVFQFQYTTGQNCYAIISPLNAATYWNGTTYETYNSANWTNYAITTTEGPLTYYVGTWPTTITRGWYTISGYLRAGGTPAYTDTALGSFSVYYDPDTIPSPAGTVYSGIWRLSGSNETDDTTETLYINEGDTVPLAFSFQRFLELQQGESISTATIPAVTGLTIGAPTTSQFMVVANFSGTADATAYTVTVNATFTNGSSVTRTRKLLIS